MSRHPDKLPSADGRHPRVVASIQPDLGEDHPITRAQLEAKAAFDWWMHERDRYDGPQVVLDSVVVQHPSDSTETAGDHSQT